MKVANIIVDVAFRVNLSSKTPSSSFGPHDPRAKTFKGDPSTSLGFMNLNSLILQDDISKINYKLEDARAGCEKIDNTIKRKQLSVNYDRSKFLIMGNPKYRKDTLKAIKERPMNNEY